ncbi:mechanosensitive ion channel [Luteimonas sp. e5]
MLSVQPMPVTVHEPWQVTLQNSLGTYLPHLLGGLAILLIGWLVALALSAGTRRGLNALGLNRRLNGATAGTTNVEGRDFNYEKLAARLVFWFVLLLALLGMFSVFNVDGVYGPLSVLVATILEYLPRILLALALAALAWIVATVVRSLVNRALDATRLDEKLSEGAEMPPVSASMGNVAYWLVLLLFLPAIVGVLRIEGLMGPLTEMTTTVVGMLPNIFVAVVIGVLGWVIAKVVRGLVVNLLSATGVDRFAAGSEGTRDLKLSQLGGTLAFIAVFVPALIAALDALHISAISAPLTHMLDIMVSSVPAILAATAILLLAWYIGRFVASLITRLLNSLGLDRLPERLGLGHAFAAPAPTTPAALPGTTTASDGPAPSVVVAADPTTSPDLPAVSRATTSLSGFIGKLALFFIMLFATVEAADLLGFAGVRDLLATFIAFGADILLGLVIFVVGYWLANLAAEAIQRANPNNAVGLSRIARIGILGLVVAMGLRAMGIADDIVNLAFALVLGAVAVAVAIAFGVGGRHAAGRVTERWAQQYLERKDGGPPSRG